MAENSTSKNQQFLQQFERQRLSKLCNRVIDLRGKVAGECQAYTFGGKTHYLDDRAYLLAKQLLDRYKGRYTFGVYETLLKALKSLPTSSTSKKKEDNLLLHCDKNQVQMLAFDNRLQRKEPRIIFASPVEIRIADMLYHGTTMDITTSAIGVSLKLTSTLDQGDEISVSFPELGSEDKHALLSNINYTILKINHDERRTQLILIRKRNDDTALSQWLDEWSQHHNTAEYLDLDTELFNLATHYYLRLYCSNLNSALFWLGNNGDDAEPIKAFHLNTHAKTRFSSLLDNSHDLDFSVIPFERIINNNEDFLLLVIPQGSCFIAPRHDDRLVARLLNKHVPQQSSQILLIQAKPHTISSGSFEQERNRISAIDSEYAKKLEQRLSEISQLITVTNISESCQYIEYSAKLSEPDKLDNIKQIYIPHPTVFRHHIQRKNQRFVIRTKVKLHLPGIKKTLEITTTDASHQGLSFTLPRDIKLEVGTEIHVDFSRWQSQTTAVNLQGLSYIVRNKYSRSGQSYYGLERDTYKCRQSINRFFSYTIDNNKEKLNETDSDVFISQETRIFTSHLGENLTAIPFYLGMDNNNQRLLQAVVGSLHNQANDPSFWRAMQQHITAMSNELNSINHKTERSASFGLYCYQDHSNNWQIQADYNFTSPSQKSLFINLALRHDHVHFYHCSLVPITTESVEQESDLNQTLLQFRTHSPHKVKQIREILHGLFAIGELINITDIVQANFSSSNNH